MKQAQRVECECGCGKFAYHSQLAQIEVEHADDKNRRKSGRRRIYWVTKACQKPFEEELGLQKVLTDLVLAWRPTPRTKWRFWLWPIVFNNWLRRLGVARRVMQLTHEIYERPRGFEYARVHATNSAVMFGAPHFLQGFLARRMAKRLKKEVDALIAQRSRAAEAEAAERAS